MNYFNSTLNDYDFNQDLSIDDLSEDIYYDIDLDSIDDSDYFYEAIMNDEYYK